MSKTKLAEKSSEWNMLSEWVRLDLEYWFMCFWFFKSCSLIYGHSIFCHDIGSLFKKSTSFIAKKKNKEKYKISNISVVEFNTKKVCLKPISCHIFNVFIETSEQLQNVISMLSLEQIFKGTILNFEWKFLFLKIENQNFHSFSVILDHGKFWKKKLKKKIKRTNQFFVNLFLLYKLF